MQTLYEFSFYNEIQKIYGGGFVKQKKFLNQKQISLHPPHSIEIPVPSHERHVFICKEVSNFAKYLTKGFHLSNMFQDILSISAFDF